MIALITPTGARAQQIKLCAKWMRNQTYKGEVVWIIVDDVIPTTTDFIEEGFKQNWKVVKRFPNNPVWVSGMNTQSRNLREGMEAISELPHEVNSIFIIEDDDYYSPEYLEVMVEKLQHSKLVGEMKSCYYHIRSKKVYENKNTKHSSLFQTAFDVSLSRVFGNCLRGGFIDIKFWGKVTEDKELFLKNPPLSVGIKGMGGRNGIGAGHLLANRNYETYKEAANSDLKTLIRKEDAKYYETSKY